MLICIPQVLTRDQIASCWSHFAEADWVDGRTTAGTQAMSVKRNRQLPPDSSAGRAVSDLVLDALGASPQFLSAALPLKILPPMVNRYGVGETFGTHVDNAIRGVPGTATRIRTDLSATLFLTEPEAYDGGDLVVEDYYGTHEVKLAAGDLVLYPSTSLHMVKPVTRGERISSVFWLQSMIRDQQARTLLYDLDQTIQALSGDIGMDAEPCVRLTGIYHNMIRYWAET